MVGLHEGVERHLPVDRRGHPVAGVVVVSGQPVAGEFGGQAVQRFGRIGRRLARQPDPDHAVGLGAGQRRQRAVGEIDAIEAVRVRYARQPPVRAIGPTVIGAGEAAPYGARPVEQAGAAVAAAVQEGPRDPVFAAHEQDRHADEIFSQVAARPGQPSGKAGQQGLAAQDARHLGLEPAGIGVDADGIAHDIRRPVRRAGVQMVEHAPDQRSVGFSKQGFARNCLRRRKAGPTGIGQSC